MKSGEAHRQAGVAPPRGRAIADAARRRADRSLSDALAGGRRHADRGVLADAARPQDGRQGARGRALEPQGRSARSRRAARPRRHAAAAVLAHPPRRARRGASVVPRARHRRHRLQPDAVGAADRIVHRSAGRGARPDDWRSRSPEFQSPRLQSNLALADALRPIAARHGTTVGAIAVAWTLAAPGVTGAIVGARNPAQVDGWIDAGRIELTPSRLVRDRQRHRAHRGGDGASALKLSQLRQFITMNLETTMITKTLVRPIFARCDLRDHRD